jgi:hypothetical protein
MDPQPTLAGAAAILQAVPASASNALTREAFLNKVVQ